MTKKKDVLLPEIISENSERQIWYQEFSKIGLDRLSEIMADALVEDYSLCIKLAFRLNVPKVSTEEAIEMYSMRFRQEIAMKSIKTDNLLYYSKWLRLGTSNRSLFDQMKVFAITYISLDDSMGNGAGAEENDEFILVEEMKDAWNQIRANTEKCFDSLTEKESRSITAFLKKQSAGYDPNVGLDRFGELLMCLEAFRWEAEQREEERSRWPEIQLSGIIDSLESMANWQEFWDPQTKKFICIGDDFDDVSDEYLENCYALPDSYEVNEYGIMEDFIYEHTTGTLQAQLEEAIRGRSAFKRFRDLIGREGIDTAWYEYRDERLRQIATTWAENHNLRAVDND